MTFKISLAILLLLLKAPSVLAEERSGLMEIPGSLENLYDLSNRTEPLDEVQILGEQSLIYSARNFNVERLEVIAKAHHSLDIVDDSGTTAVMHALMSGRVENAKLLHELGASLEGVNDQGYSVRVLAENVGLMDFGPEYPVTLSGPTIDADDSNRLLLLAAETGETALLGWALSLGADLSAMSENGMQAAHLAAFGGHEDTFDWILDRKDAPVVWETLKSENQNVTLVDFIIAGEGGGDHARAHRILLSALEVPSIAEQFDAEAARYKGAMETIGYSEQLIASLFRKLAGEAELGHSTAGDTRTAFDAFKAHARDILGRDSNRPFEDPSEQIQSADTPRDAYEAVARILQSSLRVQGCAISKSGSLAANTVDGLFGVGSNSGISAYNEASRKYSECLAMTALEPIGSKINEYDQSYLAETWLTDALENISRISFCSAAGNKPICGCDSDIEYESKSGACVERTAPASRGVRPNTQVLASWSQFCRARSGPCIWIAYEESCVSCGKWVAQRLEAKFNHRVRSSGYENIGGAAGCIGYREDIADARTIAEIAQVQLGRGYYLDKDCAVGAFPVQVYVR